MPTLEERIKEFNELEYRDQCRYIVNKLISLEYIDIMHTVFFKRHYAHCIFQKITNNTKKRTTHLFKGS